MTGTCTFPAGSISSNAILGGVGGALPTTATFSNLYSSNIGIGTSVPAYPLDIVGNARVTGNISAGNLGMFRNRIINGDMMINQRGVDNVSAGSYGVDRWQCISGTMGISKWTHNMGDPNLVKVGINNSLLLSGSTEVRQYIELLNSSDLFTSPITVSFWVRSSLTTSLPYVTISQSIDGSSSNIAWSTRKNVTTSTTWSYFSTTFPAPASIGSSSNNMNTYGITLVIGTGSIGASDWVTITGVQLEKGTIATPFEFRPYAIELQMCQRYYIRYNALTTNSLFGIGIAADLNNYYCVPIGLPTMLRDVSTATSSYYGLKISPGELTVTSQIAQLQTNSMIFDIWYGCNGSGQLSGILKASTPISFIEISSEL